MEKVIQEIEKSIKKGAYKPLTRILNEQVEKRNIALLDFLMEKIGSNIQHGMILKELVKAFFQIKRDSLSDVSPIYLFDKMDNINIHESLLEVLGYDKMVPDIEDQKKIIEKYFHFGDDTDYRSFTNPRYGLAAACAGWDMDIVRPFLEHCIKAPDAPLKYVAENSLKRKYVKLR